MTVAQQLEKIGISNRDSSDVWERAVKSKINQVYAVDAVIKNYKRSHGSFPHSVREIEDGISRSGAFASVDSSSIIFALLMEGVEREKAGETCSLQ